MVKVDKLSIFDTCVDGSVDNFNTLIVDPVFDQFNRFYEICKKTFPEKREDSVSSVIFKKEDDTVSFLMVLKEDADLKVKDKTIKIVQNKNEYELIIPKHEGPLSLEDYEEEDEM